MSQNQPFKTEATGYQTAVDMARTVRDCVAGERAVKAAGVRYLPIPNPQDYSDTDESKNKLARMRYDAYIKRAMFLNVTGRTEAGLVGMVMREAPTSDLPAQLDYANENADSAGASLTQIGQTVVGELLEAGIYGLLADYPRAETGLTVEQVQQLGLRARMVGYPLESIINFRADLVGGAYRLRLVVLKELRTVPKDIFTVLESNQYRVLRIDENGLYVQEVYAEDGNIIEASEPTKADGSRWTEIPFSWIGAEKNEFRYQKPPLADLADVNIAHYRNSADKEEALFMTGQPTLVLWSELNVNDWERANPNGVVIGSRSGHFLGPNGGAELLTMQAGSALEQAMKDKRDDMVSIGAQLITQRTGTQTAEAARIDASADASVLSTLTGNASEGIEKALEWMAEFMGADPAAVNFSLNRRFFDVTIDPQMAMAVIQLADRGDIAQSDVRDYLRTGKPLASNRTDDEINADVETAGGGLNRGIQGAQ